jgi:hypothetical protein
VDYHRILRNIGVIHCCNFICKAIKVSSNLNTERAAIYESYVSQIIWELSISFIIAFNCCIISDKFSIDIPLLNKLLNDIYDVRKRRRVNLL